MTKNISRQNLRFLSYVPATSIASSLLLASALAAAAPDTDTTAIEEVFVTAQKREQILAEIPMSISSISGEVLAEMGAEGIRDIAFGTPGFTVSETGPGAQNFQIRGISSVAGRSTVGYYLDDVILSALVSPIIQPDTNLYDLQRVEILRGPQGSLYGEGSMGGTLKLLTNNPLFNEWGIGLHAAYEIAEHRGDPSEMADATVNVPLLDDRLALRLVASTKDSGGYIDFPGLGTKNGNSGSKDSARAKLLFAATDRFTLSGMVLQHRADSASQHVADKNFEFPGPTRQTTEDEYQIYTLSGDYAFEHMNLLVTTSRFDRQSLVVSDLSQSTLPSLLSFGPFFDPLTRPLIVDTFDIVPFSFDTDALIDVGEVRLSSSDTEHLFWTFGLFSKRGYQLQNVYSEARSSNDPSATPVVLIDGVQSVDTDTQAIFGQVEYLLTDRLTATFGARRFEEELEAAFIGGAAGLDTTHIDKAEFSATTPKLSLDYVFIEKGEEVGFGMVYISAATGFRSGGANIRTSGGFDEIPALYDPEYLKTYEIGTKLLGADGNWSVELSVYNNNWKDIQIYQDYGGFNGISNQGRAEAYGVDWSLMLKPEKNVSLILSGNYNDSVFAQDTPDKNKGDGIDFVPVWTASLALKWNFNWTEYWPASLRLDYNFQDSSRFIRRSDNLILEADELHILNLRLGLIEQPQWQVSLYGRNLLDEDGKADTISQSQMGAAYASRLRPTHFGIDLRWQSQ